jgi:uncharacterized protein YbjQ (UPF0145 family)
MLISTMNDLPGYTIDEVLGEVFGLTVRSRNVGSQIGATLKSLRGGELKGMTKMLAEGRQHAQQRLVDEANERGANAVLAFRFDTSELGSTWTEICAYGTAVKVTRTS